MKFHVPTDKLRRSTYVRNKEVPHSKVVGDNYSLINARMQYPAQDQQLEELSWPSEAEDNSQNLTNSNANN